MKQSFLLLTAICFLSIVHAQSWSLTGNAGTTFPANFIGTTDAQPLFFRVNNAHAGKLSQSYGQTFLGYQAGNVTTNGAYNSAIGFLSLTNNTTGYQNTVVGAFSMYYNSSGYNNSTLGVNALYNNTTGYNNVSVGTNSMYVNTSGFSNTAIGVSSLNYNTAGGVNVAIGTSSMLNNTTGSANTAVGYESLINNTSGPDNTALGLHVMNYNTTGGYNTALGVVAMNFNTTGSFNCALGFNSLGSNTSGMYNCALGNNSMQNLNGSSASYNTSIGAYALNGTLNSQYNAALGYHAGFTYNNGYNNVFLGANTDVNASGYYNVIAIGQSTICTAPSQVTMGNGATSSYRTYANWTNISDGRFKKNVKENVPGLDFIVKLRPVTYTLDATGLDAFLHKTIKDSTSAEGKALYIKALKEKEQDVQMGFVAQDVEKTAKEMNLSISAVEAPKNANDVYGIRYSELVVPLVKAIQEQQKIIDSLRKDVASLKEQADITVLLRETLTNEKLSVYPNPVANDMTVSIITQNEGSGALQVYDAGGKLVKQISVNIKKGLNTTSLSLPVLSAGVYTLKIIWGKDMRKQVSFIKSN